MKQVILFFIILITLGIFFSCRNTEQQTATSVVVSEIPNSASPMAAKVLPGQKMVKDTTPPQPLSRVVRDMSRPKNEIKSNFPFDIPMTSSNREEVNSEIALKNNGKPTVVLFWLTTCYPCRIEMNAIKKVYPEWKKEADFNLVGISTDFPKNYERFVKRVAEEKWEWDVFHDTNREFRKVLPGGLNGLPQTFIFDKDGKIVYHKRKYSTGDEHQLFDIVKNLVAKK